MKLLKAVHELQRLHCNINEDEIVLQQDDEHMIVASQAFIYVPEYNIALFDMMFLARNDYGEYEPDWSGTAIYQDGNMVGYESSDILTSFHNFATHTGISICGIDDAYITDDYQAVTKNVLSSENETFDALMAM